MTSTVPAFRLRRLVIDPRNWSPTVAVHCAPSCVNAIDATRPVRWWDVDAAPAGEALVHALSFLGIGMWDEEPHRTSDTEDSSAPERTFVNFKRVVEATYLRVAGGFG